MVIPIESIYEMSEEELLSSSYHKDIVDRIKGTSLEVMDYVLVWQISYIEGYKDAEYNKLHGKEKVRRYLREKIKISLH